MRERQREESVSVREIETDRKRGNMDLGYIRGEKQV